MRLISRRLNEEKMNRRRFIQSLAIFSGITFLGIGKYINHKQACEISNEKPLFLDHIEIHLVEHCNLNCKYCSHFSSIAEKKFYDVNKYEKDMARLAYVTKGKIGKFSFWVESLYCILI